jgi:shikimate kinase
MTAPVEKQLVSLLNSQSSGRPVFLIGYRCTGKSSIARLLAQKLRWNWLDADVVLEARHGRSIRQIFADEGEAGFRDKEMELLDELCRQRRTVIATGGGVILREINRKKLREAGRVVWLTAEPETIWQRMQACTTTAERRPNLSAGGLAEIQELLCLREPWYRECADAIIATGDRSPEQIVDEILQSEMLG